MYFGLGSENGTWGAANEGLMNVVGGKWLTRYRIFKVYVLGVGREAQELIIN